VHHSIKPLWRTAAIGIARTARYLPYEGPVPQVIGDEYTKWASWYYGNVCTDPWGQEIEPGDFVYILVSGKPIHLPRSTLGEDNLGAQ
jgi:hypothetical protein